MDSPQVIAKRWSSRIANSTEKIKSGINNVTINPMESAANAQEKYQQAIIEAVQSGRYRDGLMRVSLSDWKNAMLNKGVQRMASGAAAAEPKMANFLQKFLPAVASIQKEVQSMPSNTHEERMQRMLANANRLHELKGQFK